MKGQTLLILAVMVATANAIKMFTPLVIDKHPCKAKNLKRATTYICDSEGNVRCINGWKKDPHENMATPCSMPVCDPPCGPNGECRAPNYCACNVGWEGRNCSDCIDLPGCDHGSCGNRTNGEALTCKCDPGWTGGLCDIPICDPPCGAGVCISPNRCDCIDGWTDSRCRTCVKHPGCVNGSCINPANMDSVGHGCFCQRGFTGTFCDEPDCSPNVCYNGECQFLADGTPECVCRKGWQGANCTDCVPQPNDCSSGMCYNNKPWSCFVMGNEKVIPPVG